jgi:hypothetical protein
LNADRFPGANATSPPSEIEPPGLDGICDDFFLGKYSRGDPGCGNIASG